MYIRGWVKWKPSVYIYIYIYIYIYLFIYLYVGTAVAQWLRCCATNQKVAGSIPAGVSGFFIDIKSSRSHHGPGVDSASNRVFSGGKGGRCVRLTTLPPSCAVVTKSGSFNFLEPSGPVQACNWTALPLHIYSIELLRFAFDFPSYICTCTYEDGSNEYHKSAINNIYKYRRFTFDSS